MKKWVMLLAVLAMFGLSVQGALASGTLADNGTMTLSFNDATGQTMISGTNDGTYIWTASGGGPGGNRLARYNANGSLNQTYADNIDYRCLFMGAGNQMYAKEYCGKVYSISQGGAATYMYQISDPDCQDKGGLSADNSTFYLRSGATVYKFNFSNGSGAGNFSLSGLAGNELAYPATDQLAVAPGGRLLTFADGVVSEWPVGGGARIGQCNLALSGIDFNTDFSFGVGVDNKVYVWDSGRSQWTVWDIGLGQPVPVKSTSWGQVKSLYR